MIPANIAWKQRERDVRNRRRVRRVRRRADAARSPPSDSPPMTRCPARRRASSRSAPTARRDDGERRRAHHERVERALVADEPPVEEREPGHHQHHERGGDQHPRGVARGERRSGSRTLAPRTRSVCARACTSSAVTGVRASTSRSPVRMRTTRSSGWTKIFPSPTSPVRAALEDRLDRRFDERLGHGHLDADLVAELEHERRAAVVLDDFAARRHGRSRARGSCP